jgi:hypothetical protein
LRKLNKRNFIAHVINRVIIGRTTKLSGSEFGAKFDYTINYYVTVFIMSNDNCITSRTELADERTIMYFVSHYRALHGNFTKLTHLKFMRYHSSSSFKLIATKSYNLALIRDMTS